MRTSKDKFWGFKQPLAFNLHALSFNPTFLDVFGAKPVSSIYSIIQFVFFRCNFIPRYAAVQLWHIKSKRLVRKLPRPGPCLFLINPHSSKISRTIPISEGTDCTKGENLKSRLVGEDYPRPTTYFMLNKNWLWRHFKGKSICFRKYLTTATRRVHFLKIEEQELFCLKFQCKFH